MLVATALVIGRSLFSRECHGPGAAGLKRSSMRDAVFLMGRNGEQYGGHPRFDVELQAGDDDRHAQRVRPDTLATAQRLVARPARLSTAALRLSASATERPSPSVARNCSKSLVAATE
jgi:hypothetical protein